MRVASEFGPCSIQRRILTFVCWSLATAAAGAAPAGETASPLGRRVEPFTLQDYRGKFHALSDFDHAPWLVIAFLGTECPLAKLYGPRLADLDRQYQDRGVALIGIDANCQDSITEIAAYARKHGLQFPLLKDSGNRVADRMGAVRTPEVFVLDRQRRVRYWGRIDDQYGVGYVRDQPTRQDLKIALDELIAGKPVSQPQQASVGCHIGRITEPNEDSPVTYSKQIADILQRHCVECHRPGEIAPFSLTEYDEVVGWADTIEEVIRDQRMPPWHANPDYGRFVNARLMSDEEKELVYRWVANGAPQGDPNKLPPPGDFVSGWRLPRPPDQVIAMRDRPFRVPAEETVQYQYFVVDPELREDKWVSAAEVIPGNRSVVHHAIVFVRPPDGVQQTGLGWLAAYVPGQSTMVLSRGQARFVPAGSKLVFQLHYTPNGSVQQDVTKIGLIFADPSEVREEVITMIAIDRDFEIPPHAENYPVTATVDKLPGQGTLLALAPHMHVRGKSFRFVAHQQGQSRVLLDVPRYDFNWQHAYVLAEPMPLTKGLQIECIAHYDNSENNLVNPDPDATVRWGDQTWQEMMLAYFEIAVPVTSTSRSAHRRDKPLTAEQIARAQQTARELLDRFDKNRDGRIRREEVPDAFSVFGFRQLDANGDQSITRAEAYDAAQKSLKRRDRRMRF